MPRVAVVGAGLAGLTAAIFLERNGVEVCVYEASDRVGGRVTTDLVDGFRCDRGFQVINPSYSEIKRLKALDGIDFSPINTNISINNVKFGTAHWINNLKSLSSFKRGVLNPFLQGVYLTNPETINSKVDHEIKRSFIWGRPGVPTLGVREFSEGLADRIGNIFLNATVQKVVSGKVYGNFQTESFDVVLIATDPTTSAYLTGVKDFEKILPSFTWYHSTSEEIPDAKYLKIRTDSSLVNSVVISEVSNSYAPKGTNLIASTSIHPISESEVKKELAKTWKIQTKTWDLVARYDLKQSLTYRKSSQTLPSKVGERLYLAGDHRDIPSQNGAMRSGRRAALNILKDLNIH